MIKGDVVARFGLKLLFGATLVSFISAPSQDSLFNSYLIIAGVTWGVTCFLFLI